MMTSESNIKKVLEETLKALPLMRNDLEHYRDAFIKECRGWSELSKEQRETARLYYFLVGACDALDEFIDECKGFYTGE